jgi:hypothetical protein
VAAVGYWHIKDQPQGRHKAVVDAHAPLTVQSEPKDKVPA